MVGPAKSLVQIEGPQSSKSTRLPFEVDLFWIAPSGLHDPIGWESGGNARGTVLGKAGIGLVFPESPLGLVSGSSMRA